MAQEMVSKPGDKVNKDSLAQTACRELMTYGLWDRKTKAKRWIKKYLLRRQTESEDLIFWPTGLLSAGLWDYRKESAADMAVQIDQTLGAYYARWAGKGCPVSYLDDLLAGETLLEAYEDYCAGGQDNEFIGAGNIEMYRKMIDKLA